MKKILIVILAMVSALSLSACNGSKKEKLYIYNWGEYMDPEVIEMFEKEFKVKIVDDEYETNEAMYAKVKTGAINYDVVFPSEYMVNKMQEENMLEELNYDNLPNFTQYIDPLINETIYKLDDSSASDEKMDPRFSVPYFWGTVGILYNTTMVDEEVTSWDILFDEKYSGNILMQNSVRDVFVPPLKLLGYSINTLNETELSEATQMLIDQKPLVQAYVIDQVRDKMIGNEAALAVIYSGEALITKEDNADLEYVVPQEGSNIWFDAVVIPTTTQNKELAEKFIDFLYRPDVAKLNADYSGYSTPNTGAFELLDAEVQEDPAAYPSSETIAKCEIFQYLGTEGEELYLAKWQQIKGK
jgi:spermidine/putrescine-binding protein